MTTAFYIVAFLFATTGRRIMRAAVGLGVPEPTHTPSRSRSLITKARPALIQQLAASGSLTNTRPLCPPRQPLNPPNKTRS